MTDDAISPEAVQRWIDSISTALHSPFAEHVADFISTLAAERDALKQRLAAYECPPGAPTHQRDERPLRWLGLLNRAEHAEARASRAEAAVLTIRESTLRQAADQLGWLSGRATILRMIDETKTEAVYVERATDADF